MKQMGTYGRKITVTIDPLLEPVLGDYLPTAWYTKHVDIFLLLVLSLLRALVPHPLTLNLIILKAAVSCIALSAVCTHVLVVRPFERDQSWKGRVRAMLLLDSAGCALLNAAVSAYDVGLGSAFLGASIGIGSYMLFVACCITLFVLLWQFMASMYEGAAAEQKQIVEQLASAHLSSSSVTSKTALVIDAHGNTDQVNPLMSSLASVQQKLGEPVEQMQFVATPVQRSRRPRSRARPRTQLKQLSQTVSTATATRDPSATRAACVALCDFLFREKRRASLTIDTTDVAVVTGALSDALLQFKTDPETLITVCRGLHYVTAMNEDGAHAFITAGVMQGLLASFADASSRSRCDDSPSSLSLVAASNSVLLSVASTALGAASIIDAGGLDVLLGSLRASLARADVAERSEGQMHGLDQPAAAACETLAGLSSHEGSLCVLTDAGAVELLAAVLSNASTEHATNHSNATLAAAAHAAHAIANLSVDDGAVVRFIAAGGIAPLVSLLALSESEQRQLTKETLDTNIGAIAHVTDANAAISNLGTRTAEAICTLSAHASGAAALHAAGIIPVLLSAISAGCAKDNLTLLEAACWALRGLSRNARHVQTLADAGGAAVLESVVSLDRRATNNFSVAAVGDATAELRISDHARALLKVIAAPLPIAQYL